MTNTPASARQALLEGFSAVGPILPGIIPFGMTAGIAALEAGMSPAAGFGMSVFIFAGASQLVVAQLISEGAVPAVIILTALIVNLRMLMYSASLAPYLGGLSLKWKAALSYLLTDQAYALSITRYLADESAGTRQWYYLGAAFPIWALWVTSTVLGLWVGAAVPASWQLGFTLPLVFLVLLVPVIRDRPGVAAAITGGGVAVLAHQVPYHLGLTIGALAGILAGVGTEELQKRRRVDKA